MKIILCMILLFAPIAASATTINNLNPQLEREIVQAFRGNTLGIYFTDGALFTYVDSFFYDVCENVIFFEKGSWGDSSENIRISTPYGLVFFKDQYMYVLNNGELYQFGITNIDNGTFIRVTPETFTALELPRSTANYSPGKPVEVELMFDPKEELVPLPPMCQKLRTSK